MNSTVYRQRIYFGKKTIEEVVSYTRFLAIIKLTNRHEVFDSGTKNSDFHLNRDRNSFLLVANPVFRFYQIETFFRFL